MKNTKTILQTAFASWVFLGLMTSCGNKTRIKERPPVALEAVSGVGFQQA